VRRSATGKRQTPRSAIRTRSRRRRCHKSGLRNRSLTWRTSRRGRSSSFGADDPVIGLVAFVPIGMSEVRPASSARTSSPATASAKGDELGYLQLGGSPTASSSAPTVIADFSLAAIPQPHDPNAPQSVSGPGWLPPRQPSDQSSQRQPVTALPGSLGNACRVEPTGCAERPWTGRVLIVPPARSSRHPSRDSRRFRA
jgi:hypothetical protein